MAIRYKKAIPALDEMARARLCDQSYYSTSSEDSDDLADLVDSFYDSESDGEMVNLEDHSEVERDAMAELLDDVLEEMEDESDVGCIQFEVEKAIRVIGSDVGNGLKKQIVNWLRERGFDAGLCMSSWEPINGLSAGSHEFIDVNTKNRCRYIIEINLAFHFEIAKPNRDYITLLERIPKVFIASPKNFKSIVRLITNASIESIKSAGMHVAPWRRKEYMLAKWFGPSERRDLSDEFIIREKEMGRNVNCRIGFGEKDRRMTNIEVFF